MTFSDYCIKNNNFDDLKLLKNKTYENICIKYIIENDVFKIRLDDKGRGQIDDITKSINKQLDTQCISSNYMIHLIYKIRKQLKK
jgi:hypothetical protein